VIEPAPPSSAVDRELEKLVQYVLRRHGYPPYELRDGLQEVRLRALEVAAELFREGKMPEHGVDILEGVACRCSHEEIGADLGISDRTVEGRLKTMRRVFKRKNRTRTRNSLSEIRDSCGSMSEGGRIEVREKRPSRPEIDRKS
jgi:DNA-binding NarL/FixJ family response regulator